MTKQNSQGFATKLVHAGEAPDPSTGAIAPVLVRTKTFAQPQFGVEAKWQYSRGKNPTRSILEKKIEILTGAGQATVFGSGDAATTMFLLTLKPGDHIVACKELYGGTIRLFDQLFAKFGIKVSYVDIQDEAEVGRVKTSSTKVLWAESPTNPKLEVIDLEKVGKIAKKFGLRFVADLTFAPPCATNPFIYGVETVIYSLSKYFGGHNDVIGGAIVTKNDDLHEKLCWLQWSVGAALSPDECYRLIQELKTLELRWSRVSETAKKIATYLQGHPAIHGVYYPGLKSHKGHEIIKKQMKNGFGSVVSFYLSTQDQVRISKFVADLQDSGIFMYAESLSSPETILAHPASMSHRGLTDTQRGELGIGSNFFRLSVGFEESKDLIGGLGLALGNLSRSSDKVKNNKAVEFQLA